MAITNFTGVENHKTHKQLLCSTELTLGKHSELIFLIVLNIFLSTTAFLGNTLTLVALHKESSLHPPSKLLLRSLATTDLCVGITVEPLAITYLMSVINKQWNLCRHALDAAHIAGYILCSVSLLTLTAISVDRLLALLLRLRYRQVVTLKRTYLIVTILWVVCISGTIMYFWDKLIALWYSYIAVLTCLVTSVFSYTKIFLTLRHNQLQVHQGQPSQTSSLNIARYRKTVSSALWVQLTLVVCYIPLGIVQVFIFQRGQSQSVYIPWLSAVTLVYLNSSLNPILYCWKIREVRQAVKDTNRDVCS